MSQGRRGEGGRIWRLSGRRGDGVHTSERGGSRESFGKRISADRLCMPHDISAVGARLAGCPVGLRHLQSRRFTKRCPRSLFAHQRSHASTYTFTYPEASTWRTVYSVVPPTCTGLEGGKETADCLVRVAVPSPGLPAPCFHLRAPASSKSIHSWHYTILPCD